VRYRGPVILLTLSEGSQPFILNLAAAAFVIFTAALYCVLRRGEGEAAGPIRRRLAAGIGASLILILEQDERSTGLDVGAETETADRAVILGCLDASVGRRIVGEPPAEGRSA
jgi:hypothetical protein